MVHVEACSAISTDGATEKASSRTDNGSVGGGARAWPSSALVCGLDQPRAVAPVGIALAARVGNEQIVEPSRVVWMRASITIRRRPGEAAGDR